MKRAVAVLVLLAACGGDATGPTPGTLQVKLTLPATNLDSAMVLMVGAPAAITSAVAGPGLRLFAPPLGQTTKLVLVGPLTNGTVILTLGVPDVGQVSEYTAVIQQVAQPNYQLRTSLAGYSLSITR